MIALGSCTSSMFPVLLCTNSDTLARSEVVTQARENYYPERVKSMREHVFLFLPLSLLRKSFVFFLEKVSQQLFHVQPVFAAVRLFQAGRSDCFILKELRFVCAVQVSSSVLVMADRKEGSCSSGLLTSSAGWSVCSSCFSTGSVFIL